MPTPGSSHAKHIAVPKSKAVHTRTHSSGPHRATHLAKQPVPESIPLRLPDGPLAGPLTSLFDALDVTTCNQLPESKLSDAYNLLKQSTDALTNHLLEPEDHNLLKGGSLHSFYEWAVHSLNLSHLSEEEIQEVAAKIQLLSTGIKPPHTPWSGDDVDRQQLSEILPGKLFLTGWRGAANREAVSDANVTHILSMGSEFEGEAPLSDLGIKYLCVVIDDDEEQSDKMQMELKRAVDFIDGCLANGGHALVHCAAGISRSATAILAYLVAKCDFSLIDAFRHTHQARPVIWPNTGFMRILIEWEVAQRKTPPTMRLSQYILWSQFDEEQYSLAKVVER